MSSQKLIPKQLSPMQPWLQVALLLLVPQLSLSALASLGFIWEEKDCWIWTNNGVWATNIMGYYFFL